MVEQVTLFELDIDIDSAVKDSKALKEEILLLKSQAELAKKQQGELSEEYIRYSAALKTAQKDLRVNTKLTEDAIQADLAKDGSIEKLRKQLSVVTVEWARLSKEERENSEKGKRLTKQKLDLTNQLKKEEKATGDTRRNVGNYTESIKEAAGSLGVFGQSSGKAVQGIQSIGVAAKTALGPIGLIIAAIGLVVKAVQAFFTSSEEGQNTLRRLQAVFNAVFGNLNDILSEIGKRIVEVFQNPKETLISLGETIKQNIINRFVGLLELTPNLGRAIGKLFKGEFKEAGKIAADAVVKVTLGVEDFTDKAVKGFNKAKDAVTGFIEEQEKEIKIAQQLADRESALIKLRRETNVQLAKNKSEIQDLLIITRDTTKSFDEQSAALTRANSILEDELRLKERIAEENLALIREQNALSNNTIEDLEREAQAEIELFNLRAENAAQRREILNRVNELNNRIEADRIKKAKEREKAEQDAAKAATEAWEQELERYKEILEEEEAVRVADLEAKFALAQGNAFALLDLEKERLQAQKEQELAFAEEIGADKLLIEQKFARAEEELERSKTNAKFALASNLAGQLGSIAAEGTVVAKGAAAAQATISTIQGATGALSQASATYPPPLGQIVGGITAAAIVASGIANVRKIYAVSEDGGGVSAASPSSSSIRSVNPAIGQGIATRSDSSTRAITDSVNDVQLQPTLVEDDVTSAQNNKADNNNTAVL